MKNELVINLVPIELLQEGAKIFFSDTTEDNPKGTFRSIFVEEEDRLKDNGDDKVLWDIEKFPGSTELNIIRPTFAATKRIIIKHLEKYFTDQGLFVGSDFIGGIKILVPEKETRHPGLRSYKEYSIRVLSPIDQYVSKGRQWTLNVSHLGFTEATTKPLSDFSAHETIISRVILGSQIRKLAHLTTEEKKSSQAFPILSKKLCKVVGVDSKFYRPANKYQAHFNETKAFYDLYLTGKSINEVFEIFESGFLPISDSQIISTSSESNLLVFGNNQTNVSPYNGLKSNGPYRAVEGSNYRFIFVFHEQDKDYANNLFGFLKKGLKGYPGLFRFVGLDVNLDREKSITFSQEDPVPEVTRKLSEIAFDPTLKYLAIYISRVSKDELDETKKSYYYGLKKAFLEKNISSQVVYKLNIEKPVFNYHLPNISIAMLAKLGGIPWRLSRPIKNDLVIGVGAFREEANIYLGTTVAFNNDGTFIRFDSKKTNSTAQLAEYFHDIISRITKEQNDIKRVVIHYYKDMNHKEEKVIQDTLDKLGLKVPYVVLTILEDKNGSYIPYDLGFPGKMPISGTCVELKRGTYLLCNNTRYAAATGQKIDDFPFPVHLKVSRSSGVDFRKEDVQELVDQVYQFSRMYWVSVKQKGRPVTVEYSEKVAKLSAFFDGANLPDTDTTKRTLWFL